MRDQPLTHFFWTTVQVTFYDTVSEWPLFAARPLQTGAAKEEGLPFLTIGVDRARGEFSQPLEDALVREVFEGGVHGAHGSEISVWALFRCNACDVDQKHFFYFLYINRSRKMNLVLF